MIISKTGRNYRRRVHGGGGPARALRAPRRRGGVAGAARAGRRARCAREAHAGCQVQYKDR